MDLLLEPLVWLLVVLLSVLGVFGNLALYGVGKRGYDSIRERFPRVKPERWEGVAKLYEEHGSLALLLSGVPVLGSLLTTAAGAFGVRVPVFVLFVFIAKFVRNLLIVVIPRELYLLLTR
jgi:membrane protein YqaA with SNARE-associated domain